MSEVQVVRIVADELPGHAPIWFPQPIHDDTALMPVSPELIQRLRDWNSLGSLREVGSDSNAEIAEHSRVGLELARLVAAELGDAYVVQMRVAGSGWRRVS